MKKTTGFTLIEIVITMSIMVILVSLGVAKFTQYGLQQKQKAAIARMRQVFQEAKANAVSGKKDCAVCGGSDEICNGGADELPLTGWSVNVFDGTHYQLRGECGINSEFMVRDEVLPARIERAGPCNFNKLLFKPDGTTNISSNSCRIYIVGLPSLYIRSSGAIFEPTPTP